MANPNIVGVQYIRGRTANKKYVKRESRYLLRNLANSNEVLKVNTITATNNSNTTQRLTIQLVSTDGISNIVSNVAIPRKTTFNVLQKNFSIYLEENSSINVSTSTFNDKIGVYCSYEQIATSLVNDRNDNYDTDTTLNFVKTGLVLNLDAGDSSSYTANSNTWFDTSDANNNGTLVNGPTFSSANGGSLVFDATNDHISIGSQNIVGTGNAPFTVEMWFNNNRTYASGAYTMLCRVKQDSEFFTLIYNPSGTYNVYSVFRGFTQFGTPVTNSDFINKWICLHAVYTGGDKNSASSYKTYINGTLLATGTNNFGTAGGTGSNCNIIGADGNSGCNVTGGYHGGNFSVYRLYNRELTSTEVTQNYNALRGRYFPPSFANGLAGKFFNGDWRSTISTGNIGTLPLTTTNESSNITGSTGMPSADHRFVVNLWPYITYTTIGESYGFIAIGYFIPPTTGTYTFYTSSDDGSGVWIGDIASAASGRTTANAVVNNAMGSGQPDTKRSGTIELTAGVLYPIRIVMEEGNGGDNLTFSWAGPGIAETTDLTTHFRTPVIDGTSTLTGNYIT
jgi:hypothetical protein